MTLARPQAVLCVGEPLIALVPPHGETAQALNELNVLTGGAELNVALHLARFGFNVRFAGMVGDDPWGARLRSELRRERVDSSALETSEVSPTGFYVKEFGEGNARMRYFRAGSAASTYEVVPESAYEGIDHVHITGVTPALSPNCANLTRAVLGSRGDRTTSFDVNYRSALWEASEAAPVLESMARLATIVFVGLDEASTLWGCQNALQVRELFPEVEELIVKNNAEAATAFTGAGFESVPASAIDSVDVIGAGDAFASAYLAARWSGSEPATALKAGHQLAASVISSTSDHGESRTSSIYLAFNHVQESA